MNRLDFHVNIHFPALCDFKTGGFLVNLIMGVLIIISAIGHSFKQLIREPKSCNKDSGNPEPSLIEGVETISLIGEYINY